ncbi:palmitoyl-protein thioesterase [Coprinopsis sp. MPI-PUGE-AT-0042]|nr:palmitoyl-protein thioesterase [Coprinopsis sp. MPI-PUGE-AT-0042]
MLSLALIIATAVAFHSLVYAAVVPSPRPLVIWHGLGDSHSSPGMVEFGDMIKEVHPGIFIHSVYIDKDLDADRKAGFYGNVDEQVALVAEQLSSIPELQEGFDAIGFSQGGQFLRAYVERYNSPKMHNLITFGSQHMGISDIPLCARFDFLCQVARRATKAAVYGDWAQQNLIQAQYFRNPSAYPTYLRANHFLASINNERPEERNVTYAHNLASLNKLVLVVFTEDRTVVPKESSWFGSEAIPDDMQFAVQQPFVGDKAIIPMRLQPLYTEDWIGLRKLDERGDVVLESCQGEHMQLGGCWERLVRSFVGHN